jgi:hypothetical protein
MVMTSPPFALQRQKAYGNKDQAEYMEWLTAFAREVHRVLKEDGSFVLELGGAYEKGVASGVRTLKILRRSQGEALLHCSSIGFHQRPRLGR